MELWGLAKWQLVWIVVWFGLLGSFLASAGICFLDRGWQGWVKGGRSHCSECGKVLKWYELIPVFSYVIQRGRCRNCKTILEPRFFESELCGFMIGMTLPIMLMQNELAKQEKRWIEEMMHRAEEAAGVGGHIHTAACSWNVASNFLIIGILILFFINSITDTYDQLIDGRLVIAMWVASVLHKGIVFGWEPTVALNVAIALIYWIIYVIKSKQGKASCETGWPEIDGFGSADLFLIASLTNFISVSGMATIIILSVIWHKIVKQALTVLQVPQKYASMYPLYTYCGIGLGIYSVLWFMRALL